MPPKNFVSPLSGTHQDDIQRLPKESSLEQHLGVTTGGNAAEWNVLRSEMSQLQCYRSNSMDQFF
ncbi:MAG: hypothetical protein WA738_09285, partial [Candidatus Angelobacter sp.]